MKKSFLIVILILALSASVFGADRVDMIVLLDNSISVLPYYEDIQNSLIRKIISEHLSPGDTFSLVTFADYPEVEISREIKNRADIEEILAYSTILQPMGNHTDLILALRFLYKYTLDLPLSNKKKIVILTDGIHDPPPDSPFYFTDSQRIDDEVRKAADEIHREGWDVSIVELENTEADKLAKADDSESAAEEASETSSASVLETVSETLGSTPNMFDKNENDMAAVALGIPFISIPGDLGAARSGELTVPVSILNRGNEVILFSVSAVNSDGEDILKENVSLKLEPSEKGLLEMEVFVPEAEGSYEQEIILKLVGGLKTEPSVLVMRYRVEEKGSLSTGVDFLSDWRILAVIAGIIAAVIIIILIRRASGNREGGIYVTQGGEELKPIIVNDDEEPKKEMPHEPEEFLLASISTDTDVPESYKKNRPVQMLVYGQNTKLGISNVMWLGLNKKRSIGSGGNCIFKIFFLKVPAVVANIECTGDDFIFYPEKPDFFPELDGPLHNCLNRKIRIVNDENHMFYIEFRQWVSELEKVNRLLSMTKHRGMPDMEF